MHSFQAKLPDTRQMSQMDDCTKQNTLPNIPQHKRQFAPPVPSYHGTPNDDCMSYEEIRPL